MATIHKNKINFLHAVKITIQRLFIENYTYTASALAFTTLLSIVPLLAVILVIMHHVTLLDNFTAIAQNNVLSNFLPKSVKNIEGNLQNFLNQATHLPFITVFFLLITSVSMILTVTHSFNKMWDYASAKKNLKEWLIYWTVVTLTPLLCGLSLLISAYLFSLLFYRNTPHILFISLVAPASLALNTLIFTILYIMIPPVKIPIWQGLKGGFLPPAYLK